MILFSLLPPLWFHIVNPIIAASEADVQPALVAQLQPVG